MTDTNLAAEQAILDILDIRKDGVNIQEIELAARKEYKYTLWTAALSLEALGKIKVFNGRLFKSCKN